MDSRKKLQIFISSTFTDLQDERQAAVEAILKAGHIPAGMELFTASNKSQWEIIKKWIDESDVYMLILGGRYGSIETTSGLSYTHLEYEYAQSKNKPLFAVVIKESALERRKSSDIEKENPEKLKEFRSLVLSNMSAFFTDSKDIKLAVHESLGDIIQDYDLVGWIRGNSQNNQIADELIILNEENRRLRKENEQLKIKNLKRLPKLKIEINNGNNLKFEKPSRKAIYYEPKKRIDEIPAHLENYIDNNFLNAYNQSIANVNEEKIQNYNIIQEKISALLESISFKKNSLCVKIFNAGNIKAQGIYVTLKFPDFVHISSSQKQALDYISKLENEANILIPSQSYNPIELAEKKYQESIKLSGLGYISNLIANRESMLSTNVINPLRSTNVLENGNFVNDNEITIKISNLMHNLDPIYNDYILTPLIEGEGVVMVKALCEEYLEPEFYEIPITVL